MKEEALFDPMINYLENHEYEILEQHRGLEHGIDIIAIKNNRKLFLQLKGDSTSPDVDFGTLIYQTIREIKPNDENDHAIVVSMKYKKYVDVCKFPLRKLRVKAFIIDETGIIPYF